MSGSLPVAVTRMTFDDEFNSFVASANGSSGWMTIFPYGGEAAYTLADNNEAQYYGSSTSSLNPFSLNSGMLSITATAANGSNPYGLPDNAGLITTDTSFSQTYGYFEVDAKLPASNAYTAELDVFEQLGNAPNTIYSTGHGSTGGVWASNSQAFTVADTTTAFHTYGVDWEPTTTTYYMDGVAIGWAPTPASMNSPMFMLLNLAVGGAGSWPGAASSSAIPASLQMNDVRVYATAATSYVGGSAAIAPGAATQTLTVVVAEDALNGDAQFQIAVNGVAVGGVLTTQSLHSLGPLDTLTINGTWNAGANTVSVNYLNDINGGTAATDRTLYVDCVTLDGVTAAGGAVALTADGITRFVVPPAPTVVGSGIDTLALTISEDAYLGNARFTVLVNGVQQGGTLVATTANLSPNTPLLAQSQVFDIKGSFASANVVTVNFLNDLYGGTAATDRNLFVLGAGIDGSAIAGSALTEDSSGAQSFSFGQATATAAAPATTPAATVVSSGADTLALVVSEDAYLGNAQFTVSVDGVQQGGTLVATTMNATPYVTAAAQSQVFDIGGSFSAGSHVVSVTFLNNAYGGSATTDRNLYVQGATIDGTAINGSVLTERSAGAQSFSFTEPVAPITQGTTSGTGLGSAPAMAPVLNLSEDAYRGDAQFTLAVAGVQLGVTQSVTTLHSSGGFEAFGFKDMLTSGTHDVAVSFLNDLYGGSSAMDRNLYVNGATLNGMAVSGAASTLLSTGTNHFSLVVT